MTNVLFLCRANDARSIIAESILRRDGGARASAHSAGSAPAASVDPRARAILTRHGYPTRGLAPKSWAAFAGGSAPRMDVVITICRRLAAEPPPQWPGHPLTAHWDIADPAAQDDAERSYAIAFERLRARVGALTELPLESINRLVLARRLDEIGRLGASA